MSHSIEEILAEGGIECEYCGESMLKSPGCKCSEIESNGVRYEIIKYSEFYPHTTALFLSAEAFF